MWEGIKKAFRWVYDWMTILTASMVGLPGILLQLLTYLGGVNLEPLVGPERAVEIITYVALVKAVLAFIESRINKAKEP